MAKFLDDCQTSFMFLGYCWNDPNKRLPHDRRSLIVNWITKFLVSYLIWICIQFFFDMRNPRNERMFVIITFVGFAEIFGIQTTFTRKISEITKLFDDYERVINQSK